MMKRVRLDRGAFVGVLVAVLLASGCEGPSGFPPCDPDLCDADFVETVLDLLGTLPERPPPDPTNAWADDPGAAKLGHALFFDPRYSRDESIACATCHIPDARYHDDRAPTSPGLDDRHTGRRAPTVYNAAYGAMLGEPDETIWQFWDGRSDSAWSQVLGPPEDPVEMGGTRTRVALLLHDHYRVAYEAVFGGMPDLREPDGRPRVDPDARPGHPAWDALDEAQRDEINRIYANFGKAIAAYQRQLVSRDSRFDRFHEDLSRDGTSGVLTREEIEGLALFVGRAGCSECHVGPNFSDWAFHNIGIPQDGEHVPPWDFGRWDGIAKVMEDVFNCAGPYSDHPDKSACAVGDLESHVADLGSFKTPTLRHVAEAGPYMHTGAFATLDDVIDHYVSGAPFQEAEGGQDSPRPILLRYVGERDRRIVPLDLDEREQAALLAFLETLTGAPVDPALTSPPAGQQW